MKIINTKSIAILLGVYNGGQYLSCQLDSIMNQSNTNWNLFIRDDGSSDNSIEIILNYCERYNNIILLENVEGNLGAKNNFFQLLKSVESQYYMFCDQDDVWLSNKIEVTFAEMCSNEMHSIDKSVVVATDLKVVKEDLTLISASFWKYSGININLLNRFEFLSVCNVATGCAMMFNKNAYLACHPILPEAVMHDCWIALKVAASGGIICFVNEPTILYRQHDKNVIGAVGIKKGYFFHKLRSINLIIKQNTLHYRMVNKIRKTGVFTYLYFKIIYFIKR